MEVGVGNSSYVEGGEIIVQLKKIKNKRRKLNDENNNVVYFSGIGSLVAAWW